MSHHSLLTRHPLRDWIVRLFVVVFSASAVVLAGCGDSGSLTGIVPRYYTGPDTLTMAGTWKGSVDGSFPYSLFTMRLNVDSTMSGEADDPLYCKVTGGWTISDGRFTATSRACDVFVVTFVAPVDKQRLTGTWSSSRGSSGTFTVAKQ